MLPNGNLLLHTAAATVTEMTPKKEIVWKYTAKPKEGYKGRIEIHAFQRLADGNTMVAESGNRRIVEVDKDGKIVKEIPLEVNKPDPHRDTRMVRKLDNGHYLVCHEGDGCVREYDGKGKVVWEYQLDLNGRPASPGHGPEGHGTDVYRRDPSCERQHHDRGRKQQSRVGGEQGRQGSLEHRSEGTTWHNAGLGHDATRATKWQPDCRQLPRRARQPSVVRSDPRQESGLDLQEPHGLWQ